MLNQARVMGQQVLAAAVAVVAVAYVHCFEVRVCIVLVFVRASACHAARSPFVFLETKALHQGNNLSGS